jgi:protein CMS1
MAQHRGDDLDDDFMPDETVALSDDDGFVGDHDNIGVLLSADEGETVQVDTPNEQPNPLLEKRRRRREKAKERRAKAGLFPPLS